ncbi:hypothetical protein [Sphingobium yanoikuyae]|uniref:hypothetical protein n=1 Tax=Sphingobium yanoikuyae TaxID=13690 RepID=UPI003D76825C
MNQPLPPPLAALLETGKISHAAQMVSMSRSSAHRLREARGHRLRPLLGQCAGAPRRPPG